jgi:putative FmdB family regulatory protein
MPIYEYECCACRARFEAMVPFADRDEVACEECGQPRVERLASTFAATGLDSCSTFGSAAGDCCGAGCCGHCRH